MSITDWPIKERPREKLLAQGAQSLSNAELLAIFLRTGIKGKTAVDIARDLLNDCNGLRNLVDAPQQELCKQPGLGAAKYAQLQAALELGRRYLSEGLTNIKVINNPDSVRYYFKSQLRHHRQEIFACLFLDTRHRVICFEKLFHGTIDTASVYPREVVKRALQNNAAAVIFAHNHPSGVAKPSQEDEMITRQLSQALEAVDIRVLDHMIVGDKEVASLAEMGLI